MLKYEPAQNGAGPLTAAGLLTAAAFALPLILLAGLICLPALVLLTRLAWTLTLVAVLLCAFRLWGTVRHIDTPGMLESSPLT